MNAHACIFRDHRCIRCGFVKAPQFGMPIDGGFALVRETTIDGERIARENAEKQGARERAEAAQLAFF